jgi:hypothetical protein
MTRGSCAYRWLRSYTTLAILLIVGGSALAQQAVTVPSTTTSIPISGGIAAATVLVSGVVGQRIYVTSVALIPVATASVLFTQGTGAGCGTGTSGVTGTMVFNSGQVLTIGDGYGVVWALAPGNSLCVTVATAAGPGSLSYAQF